MNGIVIQYQIVFIATAFFLSLILVPLIRKLAWKYQWFDKPDHRKIHKYPTPRIGGIGIFMSFILPSVIFIHFNFQNSFILFLAGSLIIFIFGVIDDFRGMTAPQKFLVQIAGGVIALLAGFNLTYIDVPFFGTIDIGLAGIPLTLIWIAGISNAINLIDGMNGLAGGVSTIAAFFIGLLAFSNGQYETAILSWTLMSAIAGFLPYNLADGKIFMGDSGSLFIGFALSVLSISSARGGNSSVSLLVPIIILGLPIGDTAMAMIRRIARGRRVFSADLGHIHHRILAKVLCPRRTVIILYFVAIILGVSAISIAYGNIILSNILTVIVLSIGVGWIAYYTYAEFKDRFQGRFAVWNRKRSPWYKNKIVSSVSQRISEAKNVERVYKLLALAGRELEVDMISLNVLLNTEGNNGVIRFKWNQKGNGLESGPIWITQYQLSLDDYFSGSFVYGKAEWKRNRRSEEDEIWVMELGKAVYEWLVIAIKDGKINITPQQPESINDDQKTPYLIYQ